MIYSCVQLGTVGQTLNQTWVFLIGIVITWRARKELASSDRKLGGNRRDCEKMIPKTRARPTVLHLAGPRIFQQAVSPKCRHIKGL
jgi:hypothetical protein